MKLLLLLCVNLFHMIRSAPVGDTCQISEEVQSGTTHEIIVSCGDEKIVKFYLDEGEHYSALAVNEHTQHSIREYLSVIYHRDTKEMFVNIDGETFDVKDETQQEEETRKLYELLHDPEFSFFGGAVKLIHDELKLHGWETPSVMFLYRMGMAVEGFNSQHRLVKKEVTVDPLTITYHGPNPQNQCEYNGEQVPDVSELEETVCRGICGQGCYDCWYFVCGDCCIHQGCLRHDDFCQTSYWTSDCISARGVLWDTLTNTYRDC